MYKLKEEIKRGIKGVILGTIAFGLALGVTFGVLYGFGYVGNKIESTIGVQYENAKRKRFENSTSYIHSMQDKLAEYKREFETEKDVDTKLAILNCIDDEFAQFDENKISSSVLRDFLISVKDGSLRMELND